jgi:hypothetical protein
MVVMERLGLRALKAQLEHKVSEDTPVRQEFKEIQALKVLKALQAPRVKLEKEALWDTLVKMAQLAQLAQWARKV